MKMAMLFGAALFALALTTGSARADDFIDYCEDQQKSKSEHYTIELLAEMAGTKSCAAIKAHVNQLKHLELYDRYLRDIRVIQYFKHLVSLRVASGKPVDLAPLAEMPHLRRLQLMVNTQKIAKLPPNLTSLYIRHMAYSELPPLAEYKNLRRVHLVYTPLSSYEFLKGADGLRFLTLENAELSDLEELPTLEHLVGLRLYWNDRLESIAGLSRFKSLVVAELPRNPFSDISELAALPNLTTLDISCSKVRDFSVLRGIAGLERISFEELELTELPDIGPKENLTSLNLSRNAISDFDGLARYPTLKELYVNDSVNKITAIHVVAKLPRLERLELEKNAIEKLVQLPPSLRYLKVARNKMPNLDWLRGQLLPKLWYFDFTDNLIANIDRLNDLPNLSWVIFHSNRVVSLASIAKLQHLREIWARGNQIFDLRPLAQNKNIVHASLDSNKIADVSVLASRKTLSYISVTNNPLGTSIKKTEDNCPTNKGPAMLQKFCRR